MRLARLALVTAAPFALAAAWAQMPTAPAPAAPQGYLPPGSIDLTHVLPPAPVKHDIRYETDRQVFRAMQKRVGTPRWDYATSDVKYDTPTMLKDFSCAAGVTLSQQGTPTTYRLLSTASVDTSRANNAAKDYWKRQRPFWIDHGKTCEALDSLGKSFDYPSGHTTKGWTLGLILAELLPDRATPILERARAYGESRIVCGVHNMSAVESGRLGATISMEAVRVAPAFQADLAAARSELVQAKLSQAAPDAAQCAADEAVLGPSVLAGLRKKAS